MWTHSGRYIYSESSNPIQCKAVKARAEYEQTHIDPLAAVELRYPNAIWLIADQKDTN